MVLGFQYRNFPYLRESQVFFLWISRRLPESMLVILVGSSPCFLFVLPLTIASVTCTFCLLLISALVLLLLILLPKIRIAAAIRSILYPPPNTLLSLVITFLIYFYFVAKVLKQVSVFAERSVGGLEYDKFDPGHWLGVSNVAQKIVLRGKFSLCV